MRLSVALSPQEEERSVTKRIAIYGNSFNPPARHHRTIAQAISLHPNIFFDELIVRPCGPRPDKESTNDIEPTDRATMVDMTFAGIPRCRVDHSDLEASEFMRTIDLDESYRSRSDTEIWHVVTSNMLEGGQHGSSEIQQRWHRGRELWERANFVVIGRGIYDAADFPPNAILIPLDVPSSDLRIRERVFRGDDICDLVVPRVNDYIRRHRLYRGGLRRTPVPYRMDLSRPMVVIDRSYINLPASRIRDQLGFSADPIEDPSCIIALGGDGHMMHTIRAYWPLRVPFFGINAGHRGFHLNHLEADESPLDLISGDLSLYRFPMLYVEYQDLEEHWHHAFAFQDAYTKENSGTIWIEMIEDGITRYRRLVCDAALVSLPVGSTAYAKSMGAQTMPVDVQALIFATIGFNDFSDPPTYRPRTLGLNTTFTFKNLEPGRRTSRAFIDGREMGDILAMNIRVSRIATAEVVFRKGHDPSAKLI